MGKGRRHTLHKAHAMNESLQATFQGHIDPVKDPDILGTGRGTHARSGVTRAYTREGTIIKGGERDRRYLAVSGRVSERRRERASGRKGETAMVVVDAERARCCEVA